MKIGGFNSLSLNDYPGEVAALVFTQGCNFRCPFCHNGALLPLEENRNLIPEEYVLEQLYKRRKALGGVVITGGEPTLQKDLNSVADKIKRLGLKVKLDTNGSHPEIVQQMIDSKLVDFIAMDIKAPFKIYHKLAGTTVNTEKIQKSIHIIADSGIAHEFRTTYVKPLLSEEDINQIKISIPEKSTYKIQKFIPENAYNPEAILSEKEDIALCT